MKALGVDPGTQCCALVLLDDLRIERVAIVKVQGKLAPDEAKLRMLDILTGAVTDFAQHADVVVVEGQQMYASSVGNDLISLAQVAGAIFGYARLCPAPNGAHYFLPRPREWKGQQPKEVNQANTLTKLGIQFATTEGKDPYCYPTGCAVIAKTRGWHGTNKGDWKHLSDAAGLALWGLEQAKYRQPR